MCKTKVNAISDDISDPDDMEVLTVGQDNGKMTVAATINDVHTEVLVASGATRSLLPLNLIKKHPSLKQKCTRYKDTLLSYTGGQIEVIHKLNDV